MKKKSRDNEIILLDGSELSINLRQKNFLIFMCENGFFKETVPENYVSLNPKTDNPLMPTYISSIVPSSKVTKQRGRKKKIEDSAKPTEAEESICCESLGGSGEPRGERPHSDYISYFESRLVKSKTTEMFDLLMFFHISRTYFKIDKSFFKYISPSTSEARRPRSGEGVSPTDIQTDQPQIETTTEGSEFEELDRYELTLSQTLVKEKINTETKSKALKLKVDSDLMNLALRWLEYATENMKWKKGTELDTKYYKALLLVKEYLDCSVKDLEIIFNWSVKDDFWQSQVFSPISLLTKKKNGLRKIDNLLTAMKRNFVKLNPLTKIDTQDLEKRPF